MSRAAQESRMVRWLRRRQAVGQQPDGARPDCRRSAGRPWSRAAPNAAHLVRPVIVVGVRRRLASMLPITMLASGIGLAARWAYTTTARSGRLSNRRSACRRVRRVCGQRVAVDHQSMLPAVMPKERVRLAQALEGRRRVPVRLAVMPTRESPGPRAAADQRHAEAQVVDVGVAGDDDDVALVPARASISARDMGSGLRPRGDGGDS